MEHVWEDGIFQLGNKFSKSIRLKDVNYKAAGLDKRMQIIENYGALLDGIEPKFKKFMFHACKDTKFALATLGNDAGIYGGFRLIAGKTE